MQKAYGHLKAAAILGLAILSAGLAHAGPSIDAEAVAPAAGGPEDAVQVVAAVLELTPEQVAAWSSILAARAEALRPLVPQIEQRQRVIAALLAGGNPPPPVVGQLLIEIHALERQAVAIKAHAVAQLRQLLAPPQALKLEHVRRGAAVCPVVPAFAALDLVP
jgi:hypothetical protein